MEFLPKYLTHTLKYMIFVQLLCFLRAHRFKAHVDRLVQERHNSITIPLELRLSCTNLSIYVFEPSHDHYYQTLDNFNLHAGR